MRKQRVNIFSGYAGVVQFGGVRIGGITGIYKANDYLRGDIYDIKMILTA